ncbi:hypothetical protein [Aurantivibrio infirmus]
MKKAPKAKAAAPTIEEQTAAFLKSGGAIQQIPTGVSGQTNLAGPKHITLGNKNSEARSAANSK